VPFRSRWPASPQTWGRQIQQVPGSATTLHMLQLTVCEGDAFCILLSSKQWLSDQMTGMPQEAVKASRGCGNLTALAEQPW
jgi:hypothetical protein